MEGLPLFGYLFPAAQAGKRDKGRFSNVCVNSILRHLISSISDRAGNHNHNLKSKIEESLAFNFTGKLRLMS
jgi:hypothetical protein